MTQLLASLKTKKLETPKKQTQHKPGVRVWHHKPMVSYFKSGDPTLNYHWVGDLTDINIILTKRITDEFIKLCVEKMDSIFLHVNITGMGKSVLEPNIPTVKETFMQIHKLISSGFPTKQILVTVNPVLPNDNGLEALRLLLRVFTEFKVLRLRTVRLTVMTYRYADDDSPDYLKKAAKTKFMIANNNINKRPSTKTIIKYLNKTESFFRDYYSLIRKYESIISVDKGEEALIGVRELKPFALNNSWPNGDGTFSKLIEYENNNRWKPIVNVISAKNPVRCNNRCLLCPHKQ